MDIILLGHLLFMLCSLLIAIVAKSVELQKTNTFFGYRTPFALKNNKTWKEANRYSARVQILASIVFCVLAAGSYLVIGGLTSFYLCSFLLALSSISIVPITEYHLRKKFDSNGNHLS